MENYKPMFSSFRETGSGLNSGLQFLPRKKPNTNLISEHRRFASQLNPNINILDPIFRQRYTADEALAKKKQLRRQSLNKITSGLRMRSFSTFGNIQLQGTNSEPYKKDTKNRVLCSQKGNRENFIEHKFKLSCVHFQKAEGITQIQTLDWGKKNRKKIRKLTEQLQYEKNSNQQSTVDFASQQNCPKLKNKVVQFKKSNFTRQIKDFQEKQIQNPRKVTSQLDNTFKSLKKADFEIGKKLGSGNFSTAYLVRHKKTGFLCAMKIMSKQRIKQQNYQGQIAREITIQAYMRHHNIVQLYGAFQDQENVYLLLEFCIDGHLFSQIRKNSRLDQKAASSVVKGISTGIQYMHNQSIIHRDLKPENIFLSFGVPKVGDFGWAVYQGKYGELRKTMSGSPLYYSPEIVQKEDYDEKVDVWGIGTITFQCLIGMAPFKVYSFMNLNRIVNDSLDFPSYVEISKDSVDFIERCLKKKAEQRWSVSELLNHSFFRFCSK